MLKGEGRPARIPFPAKRAGFKKSAEYYHRGKKGLPEHLPAHLRRLKGRARTRELRRLMRAEADLRRQPLRWTPVLLVWGLLALLSVNSLLDATAGMALPFVLLAGALAFAAAFAANPTTRMLAGVALLLGAVVCIVRPYDVLAGTFIAIAAIALIAGAIPQLQQEMAVLKQLDRDREAALKD